MAKPMTAKKHKVAPKKKVKADKKIVIVGNYKTGQLAWIKKNGVYNWPVREDDEAIADGRARTPAAPRGDDFLSELANVKELWLYANAKSERYVFSANFVGKMTAAEFRAAYPSYAKLGASKQKAYYVFKAKPVDYPSRLGNQIVLARTADFGKRCAKVKKAVAQFKKDGEFAPLAAYLPKELAQVPRPQLRVCEAAVQMDGLHENGLDTSAWSMPDEGECLRDQLEYSVVCINEFARKNGLSRDLACDFLSRYKGLDHLVRFYDVESTMPLEIIIQDLGKICCANGGRF